MGKPKAKVVETEDKLADAKRQGQAQFESIKEMVETLRAAEAEIERTRRGRDGLGGPGTYDAQEAARRAIDEDALSVQVRSGWYAPGAMGEDQGKPQEYEILLCTGGPACRIVGELSEHCEPSTARLEVQDWFQPWTEYRPINLADTTFASRIDTQAESILLEYARCFWFGE
jgi:hypothetical protein